MVLVGCIVTSHEDGQYDVSILVHAQLERQMTLDLSASRWFPYPLWTIGAHVPNHDMLTCFKVTS